jgi:hypothetical protein
MSANPTYLTGGTRFPQTRYFALLVPVSEKWFARWDRSMPPRYERMLCPISAEHYFNRRISELALQVNHSDPEQTVIPSANGERVMHARLVELFEKRGITGFRALPATVRFRNGLVSHDYYEIVTTGWAGIARPESGVHLISRCDGCGRKEYSAMQKPMEMIDWDQWTGDDFFVVWPLPAVSLVTERVAEALKSVKAKSYSLSSIGQFVGGGFLVGRLSAMMPADVAAKYGASLGLE